MHHFKSTVSWRFKILSRNLKIQEPLWKRYHHQYFLKPDVKADMVFLTSADTIASCKNYGKILATYSPDPSKCHITGKGVEVAAVGDKSTAILHLVNSGGIQLGRETLIKSLECELVSEITCTDTRANCSIVLREE